ncbi:hypothetical protein CVT25_003369 [Psilocybe cyanescens]|uniref:Uncharacterized protein n=1 Tax=Psilocybe cyanescens TaxID=93625 RepID=A0A409X531_PSICY|nr:hypothetical protein CVT25_003369 [Psilocybe cyanescens]
MDIPLLGTLPRLRELIFNTEDFYSFLTIWSQSSSGHLQGELDVDGVDEVLQLRLGEPQILTVEAL